MPAFPTVVQYDSFIREKTSESPLSFAGLWKAINGSSLSEIPSAEAGLKNATTSQYFSLGEPTIQAIAVETNKSLKWNNTKNADLYLCLKEPGNANVSYYRLRIEEEAVEGKFKFKIEKLISKGSPTVLAEEAGVAVAVKGDRLGFSVEGGKVIAWHKVGAGEWTVVKETPDEAFTTGFVGLGGTAENARLANFQCGAIISQPPTVELVDSLERNEEATLGASWEAQKDGANAKSSCKIGPNKRMRGSTGVGEPNNDYWIGSEYTEPFITLQLFKAGAEPRGFFLWSCMELNGAKKVEKGYKSTWIWNGSSSHLTVRLFYYEAGESHEVGKVENLPWDNEQTTKIGMWVHGGKVRLYVKMRAADVWTEVGSFTPAKSYTKGFIGLGQEGENPEAVKFEEGAEAGHTHTFTIEQGQTTSETKAISAFKSISQPQSPTDKRDLPKALTITQAQSATVTETIEEKHKHTLTISQATSTADKRDIAKLVPSISQAQSANSSRTVGKKLSISQAQTPTIEREDKSATGVNTLAMLL